MNVRFSFMFDDGTANAFSADVPFTVEYRGHVSVLTLNGISRTVCHLSEPLTSRVFLRKQLLGQLTSADGTVVAHYLQPAPPVEFLYWRTSDGYLWTWLDPDVDGADGRGHVVSGIKIREDSSGPRIALSGPLQRGDIRREDEREQAMLYWHDGGILRAVQFTFVGPFAKDGEARDGPAEVVTIGTPLGVTVGVDGHYDNRKELRALATQIASSLAAV